MGKMSDLQVEYDEFCHLVQFEWKAKDYFEWKNGNNDTIICKQSFDEHEDIRMKVINSEFSWEDYCKLNEWKKRHLMLQRRSEKWNKFYKLSKKEKNKRYEKLLNYQLNQEKNNKEIDQELCDYFLFKNL